MKMFLFALIIAMAIVLFKAQAYEVRHDMRVETKCLGTISNVVILSYLHSRLYDVKFVVGAPAACPYEVSLFKGNKLISKYVSKKYGSESYEAGFWLVKTMEGLN